MEQLLGALKLIKLDTEEKLPEKVMSRVVLAEIHIHSMLRAAATVSCPRPNFY